MNYGTREKSPEAQKINNQPKQELLGKTNALPTIEPFTHCPLTTEPGKPMRLRALKSFLLYGNIKDAKSKPFCEMKQAENGISRRYILGSKIAKGHESV